MVKSERKTVPRFTSVMWDDIAPDSSKGKNHNASFPLKMAETLIGIYSEVGDTILDPFSGCGTTLEACKRLSRNGIGIDIGQRYYELSKAVSDQYRFEGFTGYIKAFHGDSRNLRLFGLEDSSIDFILTSPPFWDAVHNGEDDGDLANISEYGDFLISLSIIMKEMYRVIKKDRCVAIVLEGIGKHRKEYGYIHLPLHVLMIAEMVGFTAHDELIWHSKFKTNKGKPLGSPNAPYSRTVHENILILNKRIPQRTPKINWEDIKNAISRI